MRMPADRFPRNRGIRRDDSVDLQFVEECGEGRDLFVFKVGGDLDRDGDVPSVFVDSFSYSNFNWVNNPRALSWFWSSRKFLMLRELRLQAM